MSANDHHLASSQRFSAINGSRGHQRAQPCPALRVFHERVARRSAVAAAFLPRPSTLSVVGGGIAPAVGRTPVSRPTTAGANFTAAPTYARCRPEEAVTPKYRGLTPFDLEQSFRAEHPGLLEALAGAAASLAPASAARLLHRLEAELPPALTDVAPGGDCVLVALAPGLLCMLERAADCCDASMAAQEHGEAVATASAALSILSCLTFGRGASAGPYAAAATRCKQALKAAYDAGADVRQEDIVCLHASCARSSPWLWLTPYFGHRCACAVDDFISAGWASGELAVRFAESYSRLVGRGRYQQVEAKWERVASAALSHPLSLALTGRLLAASRQLPVEMSIQLDLCARSHPGADWRAQLLSMHSARQQEAAVLGRAQRRALKQQGGPKGAVVGAHPRKRLALAGAKRGSSA